MKVCLLRIETNMPTIKNLYEHSVLSKENKTAHEPRGRLGLGLRFGVESLGFRNREICYYRSGRHVRPAATYRGTTLIRERLTLGPYRRPMLRVVGGSQGVGRFLVGEEPLYSLQRNFSLAPRPPACAHRDTSFIRKRHNPRTLPWVHAEGPIAAQWGWRFRISAVPL